MHGLFHGTSPSKMDDEQGYPHLRKPLQESRCGYILVTEISFYGVSFLIFYVAYLVSLTQPLEKCTSVWFSICLCVNCDVSNSFLHRCHMIGRAAWKFSGMLETSASPRMIPTPILRNRYVVKRNKHPPNGRFVAVGLPLCMYIDIYIHTYNL